MAQLVRMEVNPLAKPTAMAGANEIVRVVLDYLVAFRLRFVMNAATAPGARDNFIAGNSPGLVNTNPERVRAVQIDISARTPEQDPRVPGGVATCADPLAPTPPISPGRCYQVFDKRPGLARVRTVHAEVFLPNVAFEGY